MGIIWQIFCILAALEKWPDGRKRPFVSLEKGVIIWKMPDPLSRESTHKALYQPVRERPNAV
jgi:hypothetical protein